MQALKEALRAYLRGRSDLAPVRAALDAAARGLSESERPKIHKLLNAARNHGLTDDDFDSLGRQARDVEQELAASSGEPDPDLLSTVVLPAGAMRARRAPANAPGDDATVLPARPDADATRLPSAPTEADRTVLRRRPPTADAPARNDNADDDATRPPGSYAAEAAQDSTQTADSERTVLGGRRPAPAAPARNDALDDDATRLPGSGSASSGSADDASAIEVRPAKVQPAAPGGATAAKGAVGGADRTADTTDDATETGTTSDWPADEATAYAVRGRQSPAGAVDDDDTALNAHGRNEDATTVGGPPAASEATTDRRAGREDATSLEPNEAGDEEATAMGAAGDSDQTSILNDAGGDAFDIFAPENLASAESPPASSGASWPTDAPPPGVIPGIGRDFGAGDRIRDRFELISKLGEGGMGAVWKTKDLLKEEARDRNPYVAMKLLQGDFKSHPEAFIALQRETAKQQRLAHPNIATVYDFDRDGATGTVFMTMEVLEGQPMDAVIRKLPAEGLPPEEAMPLIEQLCRGLKYAHDAGLVHSDLKPGNCFLTRENTVKLLDFGIARASKTKSDVEGETTLFDPGQLGALTPTYATLEMFEGQDPDPRDDIYALAIISYQLLAGRHPYGKKSAPKARELKLEPDAVPTLNKRQNRALRRALQFQREDRTGSVAEFMEGMTPRKNRTGALVGIGLAATVIIGVLAYGPITNELERREREEVVSVIQRGDLDSLRAGLESVQALPDAEQRLRILQDQRVVDAVVGLIARGDADSIANGRTLIEDFPETWQRTVMQDARTRTAVIDFYESQRLAAANPAEGSYDFPAATAAIETLKSIYPDSATVYRIETELRAERDTLLNELGNRYNDLLAAGRLIPDAQQDDIGDVLSLVRTIDPDNRLLSDDSLRFEFESRVEQAMAAQDYAGAKQFLEASAVYAPDDPTLANLRFQVNTELQRLADQQLVAGIQQRLRAEYPDFETLADYQGVRDDLIKLADIDPANPVLAEIESSLKDAFGREMDRLVAANDWSQAEQLLLDYAKLLDIPYVTDKRGVLSRAEREAGYQPEATAERQAAVAERIAALEALIDEPRFSSDWEIAFRVPYKELIALLPLGDPVLEPVRDATAQLYLQKAAAAREAGRFAEALAYLDRGRAYYPGLPNFDAEQQAVAEAQEALREQREEQERLARLERRKGDLITAAKADDVDRAKEILQELRAGLPADDRFVTEQAPRAIATAYLNLAKMQAEDRQFDNAATFARLGLEFSPDNAELAELRGLYEAEVAKREEQIAAGKAFEGTSALDASNLAGSLARVREQFPEDWDDIARGYARTRADALATMRVRSSADLERMADRMRELRTLLPNAFDALTKPLSSLFVKSAGNIAPTSVQEVTALGGAMRDARGLFPSRAAAIADAVGKNVSKRIGDMQRSDREGASQLLAAARKVLPESAAVSATRVLGPDPVIEQGLAKVAAGELSAAYGLLQRKQQETPPHPDLPVFKSALDARLARAQENYRQFAGLIQARRKTEACSMLARAMSEWSDSPDFRKAKTAYCGTSTPTVAGQCSAKLAGYGTRARATCWDDLEGGVRGPTLVVVPAGGGSAQPFAIGKYEVSVADFNTYCRISGSCQAVGRGDDSLPVTGVSLKQAESYAQWLSANTGARYRLPSSSEWEFAANAGGKLPSQSEFNCRVESGGTVIKGLSLVDAQSGKPNGWGLINFVGNAQEWVKQGNGLSARGGAFDDPLIRCGVGLAKPHSGGADAVTSFRLVRELG